MMKKLKDEYDIIKKLGNGAFGEVYLGENKKTKEKVAIKKIYHKKMNDEQKMKIKNEVTNMMMMKCVNSVEFKDFFKDNDFYYIIMELCDCNLEEYIKEKGGLNSLQVLPILNQLNNAFMIMVNNGIIHGDLKADNILIKYTNKEKTDFIVKLSDFGLSHELSFSGYATNHMGNIYTTAPEIFTKEKYSNKCDLWSIGCIIYFMKFQKYPFSGTKEILKGEYTLPEIKVKRMEDLIKKLLIVDPDQRISWKDYFDHDYFKLKIIFLSPKFKQGETELKRFIKKDEYTYFGEVKVNTIIRHGNGICYFDNGDRYEGEFIDDEMKGKGTFYPSIKNYEEKNYSTYSGDSSNINNVDNFLRLLSMLFQHNLKESKSESDSNSNSNPNSNSDLLLKKESNKSIASNNSETYDDSMAIVECVVRNDKEKNFANQLKKKISYEKQIKFITKETKMKNKNFEVRVIVNGKKNIILNEFKENDKLLDTTLAKIYEILKKTYV